ncbi:MAG: 4-hydroxybenzoate octaprenyltransferase [Paracoccaceae bacterium]|nr:MAG: 4-hydroxybenzoate octaprenyltransferase [Paracoccaceae bacterium]
MRLRLRQGHVLPRAQRVLYMKADLFLCHEGQPMTEAPGTEGPAAAAAGRVADAPRGNWVDRHAPAATRPFLRLSRADRPIGTWLLYIPCLWGLALAAAAGGGFRAHDLWIAAGCGIGAFLMRGAGCTWNDITDRDFDARVARTKSRPLPSGQVTVRQALVWMVAQALLAALILFTFHPVAIMLGVASLALVAVYPFAKRFTWWPQVFLGLAFNWGIWVAWAAHAGGVGVAAGLLWLSGIAWTLFYDTIYAHQDKEDDALIGVKSTARLFGDAGSRLWLRGFLIASVLLMAAAVIAALVPAGASLAALAVALCGVWGFGWHMAWQLARLDTTSPDVCLRLFRSNRDAGLIVALFLAGAAAV